MCLTEANFYTISSLLSPAPSYTLGDVRLYIISTSQISRY